MSGERNRRDDRPTRRPNWLLIILLIVLAVAVTWMLIETGGLGGN
jgi:hypothetical protein